MFANAVQQLVRITDTAVAGLYLSLFRERNALLTFLFHSLFRDEREMARNVIDPLERTTVEQFRQLIEYYLQHGYRFISPHELLDGLNPDGKYALLTFDDGYHNNTLALPVMEEFRVPAVFFIATDQVQQNKCFWWDVMYRESVARGRMPRLAYRDALALKELRTEAIEQQLIAQFGPECLRPRCDIDRPFSPSELREFAANPYVHLGNHTAGHAILTNYDAAGVRAQVSRGQEALFEMTSKTPIAIAYPNGAHSRQVIQICRDLGLRLGFTVQPHKTPLPLRQEPEQIMSLGRFVPHAFASIPSQCRTYRSDILLYGKFREWYLRATNSRVTQ